MGNCCARKEDLNQDCVFVGPDAYTAGTISLESNTGSEN